MTRQEVFKQITQAFGFVPGWLEAIPEAQLEEPFGLLVAPQQFELARQVPGGAGGFERYPLPLLST